MSCHDCVNRREFLAKSMIGVAALAALEACGDGQIGPPLRTSSGGGDPNVPDGGPFTIKLSDFSGLAVVGTIVPVGHERALVRTGASTFIGLSMICTHQQCITDVVSNRFQCPCHNSRFANDGAVINGPNVRSNPITPLRVLATTFNPADNSVTVA
jgi:cytochrome b6-f complex iron-sulfur subunit